MMRTCILWLLVLGSGSLLAQNNGLRQSIDSSAVRYLRIVDSQSVLYYGNEQEGHKRVTNHPYLEDEKYVKARLSYLQVIYSEVLLRLDLSRNELVIMSPDHRNIVLFHENVDFAELHNWHIIHFRSDSLPGCPSSGYYMLLYSGKCKVLEKRFAVLTLKSGYSTSQEQYYSFSTTFYLFKDGIYYNIRNKKGLLKILNPYKKELKRFISANRLRFRRDKQKFFTLTVSEYEKLSGSL